MTPAGLILVTGPSGAGKSTVTELLLCRLDDANWVLWQADHCQPRTNQDRLAGRPRSELLALEPRMFAANLNAIGGYLAQQLSVIAELSVMSPGEVDAVQRTSRGRTLIIQLRCSSDTLAEHLAQRTTPVPDDNAQQIYQAWHDVRLSGAVQVEVDGRTPEDVADEVLRLWGNA